MAINPKFLSIKSVKNAIKKKLIDKGVNMDNVPFTDYPSKIDDVAPVLSGDATTANVLKGKTFYSTDSANKLTGTMTNNGAVSKTITPTTATQTYTIPQGYHDGSGKVTVAGAPTSLINGDALVEHVLNGKTFFSDSYTEKTGTMANNGAVSKSITPSGSAQSYTVPAGYHNGSGKVTVSAIPAKSVQSGNLYLQGSNAGAGYMLVGLQMPIKPTKIGYNITQNNADSGSWTWDFKIEGKRSGTDTWDVLVSNSASVASGASKTMSGSKDVSSSYYYSQFRVYARDCNRITAGAYIYVHGSVAW